MPDDMTTLETLCHQATPAPLHIYRRENHGAISGAAYPVACDGRHTQAAFSALTDAQFYACARASVPVLIRRLRRLRRLRGHQRRRAAEQPV